MASSSFITSLPNIDVITAIKTYAIPIGIILLCLYFHRRRNNRLPPGPKPLPLVGNIRDLPPAGKAEYLHWLKHKDLYGPISSVTVFGETLILIHGKKEAHDLLEKQSLKTSARAAQTFATLSGFTSFLPFMGFGNESRSQRKLIHQQLGTWGTAARFNSVQEVESHRFLVRLLNRPEDYVEHLKKEAAAIILKMTYGYAVDPHSRDPLVTNIETMMHNLADAALPMNWICDMIPAVRFLPDGFPGTAYRRAASAMAKTNSFVTDVPFSFVRKQVENGTNRDSFVSALLSKLDTADTPLSTADEFTIKYTASTMYGGGSETTVSSLESFLLAMIKFPDVQRRAQAEIDAVVGTDRLPGFEDKERLPYVNALVKETIRWLPVTAVGTSHVVDEDIEYAGYKIPKGALLLAGVWWFLHDPEVYADPDLFDPARFLKPRNEPDPITEAFGYGRRICPGRFFAYENIYITAVRLLATFKMSKATDKEGKPIEPRCDIVPGFTGRPYPFKYKVKPRSPKHIDLIRAVEKEYPWEGGDACLL